MKDKVNKRSLEEMSQKRTLMSKRRSHLQRIYYTMLGLSVTFIVLLPYFLWRFRESETAYIFVIYAIMPLALLPLGRARLRNIEEDIQELDFAIDLEKFHVSSRESRAEKMLRINSFQLRRYYDLNLNQNIWVFALGIFCILLGASVVGVTFYVITQVAQSVESKAFVGVVGVVGTILTNFVAAVFLRMHASATKNLADFHSRLVETQQLFLGNLIASRIQNEEQRWKTLSELALAMVQKSK